MEGAGAGCEGVGGAWSRAQEQGRGAGLSLAVSVWDSPGRARLAPRSPVWRWRPHWRPGLRPCGARALQPRLPSRPAMPPPAPPTDLVPSERAVVLLSCVLSALGSGLLVATHALWPDLRSRARRLLLFLSLADFLSAASYFYGVLQDFAGPSWDCVLQGALSTFANTSSFFWTVAIALYLYLSIVRAARGPRAGQLLWAFHIVRWVAAALLYLEPQDPRPPVGPACCSCGPRALLAPTSWSDPWLGAQRAVSAHAPEGRFRLPTRWTCR